MRRVVPIFGSLFAFSRCKMTSTSVLTPFHRVGAIPSPICWKPKVAIVRHFTSSPIENVTKAQVESFLQTSPSENGFLLLDVRNKNEVQSNDMPLIKGAQNIPLDMVEHALQLTPEQFEKTFQFPKPKTNQFIVCMCRSGRRSFVAANILKQFGYENVYNYQGSALEWYDMD